MFKMQYFLHVVISLLAWTLVSSTDTVCKTPQCQTLGTFLKKSMNEKVNPCTDFHDYVCHNWAALNPMPQHDPIWTTERVMEYRVFDQLKKLLEDTKDTKVVAFEEAKLLYKQCMSLPSLKTSNPKSIKSIMDKVGNWPMVLPKNQELPRDLSWWKVDNEYSKITGESALFDYTVRFERKEKQISVQVQRMYSPYGTLKRYLPWTKVQEKDHYKALLKLIIKNVAPSNPAPSNEQIDSDLEKVITFREELRNIIQEVASSMLHLMPIKQYQKKYETTGIDWLEKVRAMFKDSKDVQGSKIQETGLIAIQVSYFEKLAPLLKRTPQQIIVNHIHLYFAERYMKFDSAMEAELQQSVSKDAYPSGMVRYDTPREQSCIEHSNLQEALGKMYIKAYFTNKDREAIERLIEKAQKLLSQQISKSNWLDSETKAKLLTKIKAIEVVVGSPKWYHEATKEEPRTKNDINPLMADAFFEETLNRLSVSAAYLQWPIYTATAPYVIDYATTVSMLGHELYHGFDNRAVQYSLRRKLHLWSPAMHSLYENQFMCFHNQSETEKNLKLQKYGITRRLETQSTTNEDLADMMGLKLGYLGFTEQLKEEKGNCPILPGFEKLGCSKLFFIAFANNLCGTLTHGSEQKILITDNHNDPKTRINFAVGNMKEFSDTFGCTAKDPMKKEKTCDLWQK